MYGAYCDYEHTTHIGISIQIGYELYYAFGMNRQRRWKRDRERRRREVVGLYPVYIISVLWYVCVCVFAVCVLCSFWSTLCSVRTTTNGLPEHKLDCVYSFYVIFLCIIFFSSLPLLLLPLLVILVAMLLISNIVYPYIHGPLNSSHHFGLA